METKTSAWVNCCVCRRVKADTHWGLLAMMAVALAHVYRDRVRNNNTNILFSSILCEIDTPYRLPKS